MEPSLNRRFHTDILIAVPNIHSQVNISFKLEPITDPLNQFDEDLTFIPKQPSRLKLEQAKISELHTLLPSCTKNQGQLRDMSLKTTAVNHCLVAKAATNPSADLAGLQRARNSDAPSVHASAQCQGFNPAIFLDTELNWSWSS